MQIQFRQPSIGFCSVYLLANIFRNRDFLRFTEIEKFKGCGIDEINLMLKEMGTGLRIGQVLYSNQHYRQLPKGYIYSAIRQFNEENPEGVEIPVIPYLLTVRLIPTIWHHVGILVCHDRVFYLDPYNADLIEVTSFEQFDTFFIDCCAVERFCLGDDRFALLRGEMLGYEFLLKSESA